jgi:membrane protein DedA with SNARE-associated domain
MIAAAFTAVVAGDALMVVAGRYGARLPFARRCVGAPRLAALERAFACHGVVLLACGRFVPGLRAALLVVAGATRFPLRGVVVADGVAAAVSTTLWISIGWRLAAHLDRARALIGDARVVILVACAIALAVASPMLRDRASRSRDRATDT